MGGLYDMSCVGDSVWGGVGNSGELYVRGSVCACMAPMGIFCGSQKKFYRYHMSCAHSESEMSVQTQTQYLKKYLTVPFMVIVSIHL